MAINSNKSDEVVAGGGVQLYTGITGCRVAAINPTLDELHDLGVMLQKEPNYVANFGGDDIQKVVFWLTRKLESGQIYFPLEILLNPEPWVSENTGKTKFLNSTGMETWAMANDDGSIDESGLPSWYQNPETAYGCPRGVDTLIDFIKAWANVASGDDVYLDNLDAVLKGDMSELRALMGVLKENGVRVLVYVRDSKYQAVYTKHFGRIKPQRDDLFVKAVNDPYGSIKGEFTIEWQEYSPSLLTPDAAPTPAGGEVASAVPDADPGSLDDIDDDLPF